MQDGFEWWFLTLQPDHMLPSACVITLSRQDSESWLRFSQWRTLAPSTVDGSVKNSIKRASEKYQIPISPRSASSGCTEIVWSHRLLIRQPSNNLSQQAQNHHNAATMQPTSLCSRELEDWRALSGRCEIKPLLQVNILKNGLFSCHFLQLAYCL